MNKKCLMCGKKLFGHRNKQYCGSKDKIGSCANKRELELAHQRRLKSKHESIESYLYSIGDRTVHDLETNESGALYVLMWSGRKHTYVRHYLPENLQY